MKNSISGIFRSLFVFTIILLMAFPAAQAQNFTPGFQLIQKQEQPNRARYTFKKGNRRISVGLKKVGNQVNIRIVNAQQNVIGAASVSPSGNYGRNISVTQTRDGIFALMAFALDRTMNDQGTMSLLRSNAEGDSKLTNCLNECRKDHLKKIIQADLKGNIVEAASNSITSGGTTGGCEDINICTESVLNGYDDCVEACYAAHGDPID